jgi:hypothetical protein
MDDSMPEKGEEPNYPPSFFRNSAAIRIKQLLDSVTAVLARTDMLPEDRAPLEEAMALVISEFSSAQGASRMPQLPQTITEVQARAVFNNLPQLRYALEDVADTAAMEGISHLALTALDDVEKNLRRAYSIRPDQEVTNYR